MEIWLVEQGCYDAFGIAGVYSSAQKAMDAHPVTRDPIPIGKYKATIERPGGWQQDKDGQWNNGLEWDDLQVLSCMTLDGE